MALKSSAAIMGLLGQTGDEWARGDAGADSLGDTEIDAMITARNEARAAAILPRRTPFATNWRRPASFLKMGLAAQAGGEASLLASILLRDRRGWRAACPVPGDRRMSDNRIWLFDTTLRDGGQTRGVDFSKADKIAISAALDEIGIDYIEGGWPGANPTRRRLFR